MKGRDLHRNRGLSNRDYYLTLPELGPVITEYFIHVCGLVYYVYVHLSCLLSKRDENGGM